MTIAYRFGLINGDDTPDVVQLFAEEAISEWTLPLGVTPESAASEWARTVQAGISVGAWHGSKLVGCCSYCDGQIYFAVTSAHRKKGIAAETLRLLMSDLENHRIFSVVGLCRRGNPAATATLLKQGFVFKGLAYHRNRSHEEALIHFAWNAAARGRQACSPAIDRGSLPGVSHSKIVPG